MQVEFVRFSARDGVELQGWFSQASGDTAVLHIHGMSGNGYENYFLDNLREMYLANDISFFSIDTRGLGIISSFRQQNQLDEWGEGSKLGGSCYEIFEESAEDISGALEFLSSQGKTKFILQGHSLGGSKVVNYILSEQDPAVAGAVLLAPTDMIGWAKTDPTHEAYLQKAATLLEQNKGQELVSAQCWEDLTPISAQTYSSICRANTPVDIYASSDKSYSISNLTIPVLIPYGSTDIGIIAIDKTIEKWQDRVNKIKSPSTEIAVIDGASHSFSGYETELASIIEGFIKNHAC